MKKYSVVLHTTKEDFEWFYDTEEDAFNRAEDWFFRGGNVEVFSVEVEVKRGQYVKQPGGQRLERWRTVAEAKKRAYEKALPEMQEIYRKYLRAELEMEAAQ